MKLFVFVILMLCAPCFSFAQEDAADMAPALSQEDTAMVPALPESDYLEDPAPNGTKRGAMRNWTSVEIVLSVSILIFSLIVLIIEAVIVMRAKTPWSPQSILRVFGLTLILSLSTLLVVAGYDKDQIASVMGLLGVIAGYLLGNSEKSRSA